MEAAGRRLAMCAIVDAQVAHEVFGPEPSPAGRKFYEWVGKAHGRLVVGGKLLEELDNGSPDFREWSTQAISAGLLTVFDERKVDDRTDEIKRSGQHRSNDPHVLALAQVSRARLLFTNDRRLEQDFGNKSLIDEPRGRVYHTRDIHVPNDNKEFSNAHRRLLNDKRLCRRER